MPEQRPDDWESAEEISLFELGSVMVRHRAVIFRSLAVTTSVALLLALPTGKRYTSTTSFIPQTQSVSGSGLGGLAGLAGQFGVNIPRQATGESPEFFAELVTSREILGRLATEEVTFEGPEGIRTATLPDLLKVAEGESPQVRRDETIRLLKDEGVSMSLSRFTGVVSVSVRTPWPGLSQALARRIIELLGEFNLQTRQSQASAERAFVESRLAEVRDSLRGAEDRLKGFLETNRLWENSPELTFQHERLQRQVAMQQQVYTGLAEAYEQARIAEVRNTPVISVVDHPEWPTRPDRRGRVIKVFFGIVLGGMIGTVLAFVGEYSRRARARDGADYKEFANLLDEARRELRITRLFRRS